MDVDGLMSQEYLTTYFDTNDDYFYISHVREKNNRLKVRRREYVGSKKLFFEVKCKSMSGQTHKKRMRVQSSVDADMCSQECMFLENEAGVSGLELTQKLSTSFKRIALVSKQMNERVTVDYDLSFSSPNQEHKNASDLVIIEGDFYFLPEIIIGQIRFGLNIALLLHFCVFLAYFYS